MLFFPVGNLNLFLCNGVILFIYCGYSLGVAAKWIWSGLWDNSAEIELKLMLFIHFYNW